MKIKYLLIAILFGLSSCSDMFDIEDTNTPSTEFVLGSPDEIENLSNSLFYNWYGAMTTSVSPRMSMWVMADQGSSSWANSGMLDLSSEPRAAFNNSESYKYANTFYNYWSRLYGTIGQANDVLKAITIDNMEIGDTNNAGIGDKTEMTKAMAYFVKGISLGYIGLVYDQAYYVPINLEGDIQQYIKTTPHQVIIDSAINNLNNCIRICENNNFEISEDWINNRTYSNSELMQLSYSYMARFLVYNARNATENDATNWQTVLDCANKGITSDFQIYADNVTWFNYFFRYTVARDNWVRIDARIINMLDPSYPKRITDGTNPGQATSLDARLLSDFNYRTSCDFKPERGYYHFSYYEYKRYPYNTTDHPDWLTEFSTTELNLIKAEAEVHLGQTANAISIINSGSRVNRGHLDPISVSSTKEQVLDAIFYERDIELIMTGFGIGFFDMRRRDMLQKGTLLHFPIPAKELNVVGMTVYTFGGVSNADGINTSNGGWF